MLLEEEEKSNHTEIHESILFFLKKKSLPSGETIEPEPNSCIRFRGASLIGGWGYPILGPSMHFVWPK